jgi:hypothetical protein
MGTDQLDNAILDLSLRESACIGGDVAQITYVSNLVTGSAVGLAMGVEVWASRSATVGVVTELMNVHSALSVGVGVLDFVLDDCGGILIRLRELDGTGDTGITTKDSNCITLLINELFSGCRVARECKQSEEQEGEVPPRCLQLRARQPAGDRPEWAQLQTTLSGNI